MIQITYEARAAMVVVVFVVVGEFGLPVVHVHFALLFIRVLELVLAIEAAGTLRDAGIETIEVVRGAHHQDAVVLLYAVDGVLRVGQLCRCGYGDGGSRTKKKDRTSSLTMESRSSKTR